MRVFVTARTGFYRWGADTSAPASSTLTPKLLRRGLPMALPDDLPSTARIPGLAPFTQQASFSAC